MNRDDIIRMAQEAGINVTEGNSFSDDMYISVLYRFANIVAAAEREACAAQVGQQWITFEELKAAHYRHSSEPFDSFRYQRDLSTIFFSRDMADAIRARGERND